MLPLEITPVQNSRRRSSFSTATGIITTYLKMRPLLAPVFPNPCLFAVINIARIAMCWKLSPLLPNQRIG